MDRRTTTLKGHVRKNVEADRYSHKKFVTYAKVQKFYRYLLVQGCEACEGCEGCEGYGSRQPSRSAFVAFVP